MSMSGSKIREQVAHFLVDIHTRYAFCCFFCRKYILNNMIVFDFLVIYDIMF